MHFQLLGNPCHERSFAFPKHALLFPIGIQLPTIQQEMDTQSVELLEQQQNSLAGRKKLAELTRGTFKEQYGFVGSWTDHTALTVFC